VLQAYSMRRSHFRYWRKSSRMQARLVDWVTSLLYLAPTSTDFQEIATE